MKAKSGMKKAAKSMKAKGMKGKKTMRAKAKRVGVIAKGKLAKSVVFAGRKEKTQTGLTRAKLMRNKSGKIVSKAKSAAAKSRYARSVKVWADAVKSARKALGLTGFVAIGGKSAAGKSLYAKAKSIVSA